MAAGSAVQTPGAGAVSVETKQEAAKSLAEASRAATRRSTAQVDLARRVGKARESLIPESRDKGGQEGQEES